MGLTRPSTTEAGNPILPDLAKQFISFKLSCELACLYLSLSGKRPPVLAFILYSLTKSRSQNSLFWLSQLSKGVCFSFDLGSERPKKGREIQPLKKANKSI